MNELWLASYLLLWVVVAGLSFIVMGLLRQLGLIQLRLGPDPGVLITQEGLERGTLAPEFAALDVVNKQQVRLSDLKSQRVLAVFLTPTCIACRQLMPHLKEIARDSRRNVSVLTICHGSEVTCGEFAKVYRLDFPLSARCDEFDRRGIRGSNDSVWFSDRRRWSDPTSRDRQLLAPARGVDRGRGHS